MIRTDIVPLLECHTCLKPVGLSQLRKPEQGSCGKDDRGCRLLDVVGEGTPLMDSFMLADDVLRQVRSLALHPASGRCIAQTMPGISLQLNMIMGSSRFR